MTLSYVVPSSPSSLSNHFPAFHLSMSFLDVVALLSLSVFFSDFSSSHFCGSAGVEARALYRLNNCPPFALKDSCLGWPLEELGSWACATRQSSYICPFNNPVSLWCLGQLLCCGLCFVSVDEVYWFCEYISLAKRKAPLWCWVSKCCCDHLLEDVSFALQLVSQGSSYCS